MTLAREYAKQDDDPTLQSHEGPSEKRLILQPDEEESILQVECVICHKEVFNIKHHLTTIHRMTKKDAALMRRLTLQAEPLRKIWYKCTVEEKERWENYLSTWVPLPMDKKDVLIEAVGGLHAPRLGVVASGSTGGLIDNPSSTCAVKCIQVGF